MRVTFPRRIHVVPVGYETDRVIEPLKEYDPDFVYLLTNVDEKETDLAKRYVAHVQKELKKVLPAERVRLERADIANLTALLSKFTEILQKEKGNHVFINVSSGGKLASIAGTIAALMYGATPYYAEVERYTIEDHLRKESGVKGMSVGLRDIKEVPRYTIKPPEAQHVLALNILKTNGGAMKQNDLIKELGGGGFLEVSAKKKPTGAKFQKFKRDFLLPMLESRWITKEGKTRRAVLKLTEAGEETAGAFEYLTRALVKKAG